VSSLKRHLVRRLAHPIVYFHACPVPHQLLHQFCCIDRQLPHRTQDSTDRSVRAANKHERTGSYRKHGVASSQVLTKVALPGRCVQGGIFVFVHGVKLRPEPHQLLDDRHVTAAGSKV